MSQGSLYGISAERLAQLTGAHVTTARRWKRTRPPAWLQRLIALCLEGDLGQVDPAWRGWRLVQGGLVSPELETFTPGEVRAGRLYEAMALERSRRDREAAEAADRDELRRRHLVRLEALQAALHAANVAFDAVAADLSPREVERLYAAHPITRGRRARFERDGGKVRLRAVPSSST